MERLDLYAEWLDNEKELLPLLEKIRPLLEKRHLLEEKDPKLGLLREERTLPGEVPPPKLVGKDHEVARGATKFAGTNVSLVGLPDRQVPTKTDAEKKLAKAAKNKRKHEKEKEKRRNKKAPAVEKSEMDEDPKSPRVDTND